MRKRLLALFVVTTTAVGCSLALDFDRGQIPELTADASDDGTAPADGGKDGTTTDGTTDAPVTDAPVTDAPVTDAPVDGGEDANDGAVDAPVDAPADVVDGGSDAGSDAAADTGSDAGTDAADDGATDAGSDAADAADAADASASAYCSLADFDAHDLTAQANVDITFPSDGNPAQYTPNCVKIKAGSTVTFTGDFDSHPLTAGASTATSPIPASTNLADDGGTVGSKVITFGTAGTYDFLCGVHGTTTMFGGVLVVP